MANKAQIIDFLLAGYRTEATDIQLNAGTVTVTVAGTANVAYVWDDRDKTLPTVTGRSTVTLDAYGKAEVYGDGIYKFVIKDSAGSEVETIDYAEYLSLNSISQPTNNETIYGENIVHKIDTITALRLITGSSGVLAAQVMGYLTLGDGGGGPVRKWLSGSPPGTYVDNGGSVIVPTGGDGSAAWVMEWAGPYDMKWFGAVGDDATDASVSLLAMNSTLNVYEILCDDDFIITSDVAFTRDITIIGSGHIRGSGARLSIEGTLTELGAISSATANEGERTITVTGLTGLSAGDLIIIHNQVDYSFSPQRANYHDGEFAEVLSVAGTVITLTKPLESTYTVAATNKVFKVNSVTPNIQGITVSGDTGYQFEIKHARGGNIAVNRVEGGTSGALLLDKCYGTNFYGGEYLNKGADTGLQYGIAILNSQEITGNGVIAHGTRHGITSGGDAADGAVPCRRIKFNDSQISNDQPGLHCTDFHGNTKDSGYYNCDSSGDVILSGVNVEYVGGSIRKGTSDMPMGGGELNGGYIRYRRVKIKYDASSAGTVLFKFRDSAETALIENDFTVDIGEIEVDENTILASLITVFCNSPATTKSRWTMENVRLSSDLVGIQRVVFGTVSGTGIRPESIEVTDIDVDPAAVTKWMSTSGSFSGCKITLPKTHFKATYAIGIGTNVSAAQVFSYPDYPSVPMVSMTTIGSIFDATGEGILPVQSAVATATQTSILTTSTAGVAAASMATDVIASVGMDNYILP